MSLLRFFSLFFPGRLDQQKKSMAIVGPKAACAREKVEIRGDKQDAQKKDWWALFWFLSTIGRARIGRWIFSSVLEYCASGRSAVIRARHCLLRLAQVNILETNNGICDCSGGQKDRSLQMHARWRRRQRNPCASSWRSLFLLLINTKIDQTKKGRRSGRQVGLVAPRKKKSFGSGGGHPRKENKKQKQRNKKADPL